MAHKKQQRSPYEPSPRELESLERHFGRRQSRNPAPSVRISQESKGGATKLSLDHPDQPLAGSLLMEAVGTGELDFLDRLLGQLTNAASEKGVVSEKEVNFLLSVVKGIEPRDQIEARLAAQMAATHSAVMTFARRLSNGDNIPQQDSAERAYNKLAGTYVARSRP